MAIKALRTRPGIQCHYELFPGRRRSLWGEFTVLLVIIGSEFLLQLKEASSRDYPIFSRCLILFYTAAPCSVPPWCLHSPKYLSSIWLGMQKAFWSLWAMSGIYNVALQNLDLNIRHPILKSSSNSRFLSLYTCSHLSFLIASFLTSVSLPPQG